MSSKPNESAVSLFLASLETVPWFRNIGQPNHADASARRILQWESWPGPQDPGVLEMNLRHQALFDDIIAHSGEERDALTRLWNQVQQIVFRVAATAVPYDPKQDCYHAASQAVWQAAWTAGLVGLCIQSRRPLPEELEEQWNWFLQGHWPSGYLELGDHQIGPLLIY